MNETELAPRPGSEKPRDMPPVTAAPVLSPEESRQGVTSGRVRLVLVVSVMLALLALGAVYVAFA